MRIFKLKFISNYKGLSIVEVLVAAALTLTIAVGVATMMQNTSKEQRRVYLLDTLQKQKTLMENLMREQASWDAMVTNAADHGAGHPFGQLRTNVNVTAGTAYDFVLSKIEAGAPVKYYSMSGRTLPRMADVTGPYVGFTEKGTVCDNFYVNSSGNDECPFSYKTIMSVDCGGPASCKNPQFKLVARLIFNPAANGSLAVFRQFVSPSIGGNNITDDKYDAKWDAVVKRTAASVNRAFRLVSVMPIPTSASSPTCAVASAGVGQCSEGGAWTPHPRPANATGEGNGFWSDNPANGGFDDSSNLVTGGAATFRFNEPGFYSCMISVPAFATDTFEAALTTSTGTVIASAVTNAGRFQTATANIQAKFVVSDITTQYQIRQKCASDLNPEFAAPVPQCTLGFVPQNLYDAGGTMVIMSINCYKIDRSI